MNNNFNNKIFMCAIIDKSFRVAIKQYIKSEANHNSIKVFMNDLDNFFFYNFTTFVKTRLIRKIPFHFRTTVHTYVTERCL